MNNLNCIKICPVEGCNLNCDFCGLRGIWQEGEDRIVKTMDILLVEKIAKALGREYEHKRINIGQFGEPTLYPELHLFMETFSLHAPTCMKTIFTNGLLILKKTKNWFRELFNCGLDVMIIDTYVKKVQIEEWCHKVFDGNPNVEIINFYKDKPKQFPGYFYRKPDEHKVIMLLDNIGHRAGDSRQRLLINSAGNSDPKKLAKYYKANIPPEAYHMRMKKCVRPYREMVICHDGAVPICCIDWKRDCLIDVFKGSIKDIWEGERFDTVRTILLEERRVLNPCYKCNWWGGERQGLIKNPEVRAIEDLTKFNAKGKYKNKYSEGPLIIERVGIKDYL